MLLVLAVEMQQWHTMASKVKKSKTKLISMAFPACMPFDATIGKGAVNW